MDMNFVDDIEEGFVLPKESLAKDIFGQLRRNSNDRMEQKAKEETGRVKAGVNDCKKSRPTLERSLSHETTLKRQKREDFRMSLHEELYHSEWAIYSPEERRILDFVIRKASMEESKSNKGKKGSKLQQFRIHKPKIFSRNRNSTKSTRPNIPESSSDFDGKKVVNAESFSDAKVQGRKSSFIRRFIESASHMKSPSSSPKLARRTQSNGLNRQENSSMRDIRGSPDLSRRAQPENSRVLALREREMKRSSSLQILPRDGLSVSNRDRKTRADVPGKSNVESVGKAKLYKAQNVNRQKEYTLEENDAFFEKFEHFRKNPMILLDAAEVDC